MLVIVLVLLRVLHHPLDVVLAQTTLVVRDGDLVLASCALVRRRHIQDPVGVDVEGDLDLGHSARCRGDVGQLKLAEQVVVLGHGSLALVHLDEHAGLVVRVGRERLRLFGRDRRVALDETRHHTAGRLDAEGQRRHVEQKQVLDGLRLVSVQNRRLHSSSVSDRLVRVDGLVEFFAAEEVLQKFLDLWNASGPTHEDNLVDARLVKL